MNWSLVYRRWYSISLYICIPPLADLCETHSRQKNFFCSSCNKTICDLARGDCSHDKMYIKDAHSSTRDRWSQLQHDRGALSFYEGAMAEYEERKGKARQEGEDKMKEVMETLKLRLNEEIESKFGPNEDFFKGLKEFNGAVAELERRNVDEALQSDRLNRFVELGDTITKLFGKRFVPDLGFPINIFRTVISKCPGIIDH